jgi:lipopolysaccharide/colanic/teichoic acid biosynthesis glycosyltransferase
MTMADDRAALLAPGRVDEAASDSGVATARPEVDLSVVPALELSPEIRRFPIGVRGRKHTGYQVLKRMLDVLAVLLVAPLALAIVGLAVAVNKLQDRAAPAFHVQERTGAGGRRFPLLKIRTMVANAEEMKADLMHRNTRTYPDFKIDNDPRITGMGRILRATSLDELPQLWNVLRGDMSLVGPRPTTLPPGAYESWQTERFEVRPGLTGLWQLDGRASSSFVERARLDIAYVRRRSLRLDLYILLRTIPAVLGGRGE